MLEILGTLVGNVLSLPGILGFALGMMTRNIALAAVFGGLVGFAEAIVFAGFSFGNVDAFEMAMSIGVGIVFAILGSLMRRNGATV